MPQGNPSWGPRNIKQAEYLGRHLERRFEMLIVSIFVKPNTVNSNRFWVEFSDENKCKNNQANKRNARKSCEVCSRLTIKTLE